MLWLWAESEAAGQVGVVLVACRVGSWGVQRGRTVAPQRSA